MARIHHPLNYIIVTLTGIEFSPWGCSLKNEEFYVLFLESVNLTVPLFSVPFKIYLKRTRFIVFSRKLIIHSWHDEKNAEPLIR